MSNDVKMMNGVDKSALFATVDAVRQQPELARVSFNLSSDWLGGCRQRSTTGDVIQNGSIVESREATFVQESDEPVALLGTDQATSPAEYILHALAGCYAVTFAANATAQGIELDSLRLELRADIDLQGFLGLDATVRPGLQGIEVRVHAESSNASRGQLQELTRTVELRSPIRDTLAGPVDVRTTLVER